MSDSIRHWVVFLITIGLVIWGLVLYSAAIIPETLYRLGFAPVSSLPPSLIDVIDDLSPIQNIAFYVGYLVGWAGLAALGLRRAFSLYLLLAASGLQLVDWAMMSLAGQVSGVQSGFWDLALVMIVACLVIYLRHVEFLR